MFYAILPNDSEEGTFEVSPGCTKVGVIKNSVPGDPKLYVLKYSNSVPALYSMSSVLFFVCEKLQMIIIKMILYIRSFKRAELNLLLVWH